MTPLPTFDTTILPPRLAQLGFTAYQKGNIAVIVPPVVTVSAGDFLMGSDPTWDGVAAKERWARREQPQQTLHLPEFHLARYPVTVAEYACFVRSGHAAPKNPSGKLDWEAQLQRLDHPVVFISWHDAVAYANWLAKLTGQPWRLPSEAEWEKAARGTDGRIYPWGDSFDRLRCNTSEGRNGHKAETTPLGAYPTGASPFGAEDLAGNVWEWTSSAYKAYPYTPNDGRERLDGDANRVLRGGSWRLGAAYARSASRGSARPDNARVFGDCGFRLARGPWVIRGPVRGNRRKRYTP